MNVTGDDGGPEGTVAGTRRSWDRFWFQQPVNSNQIAVFRVLFFGLLAVDSWLKIGFAAGYGAGGFNVAQLGWLDPVLPALDARVIVVLWVFQAYLAARIALGGARQWLGILLAGLYGSSYLASQLDSWQHHYLLALLLVVLAWVPWKNADRVSWPFHLIRVQISLLYFWTAVSKMHPSWLDGSVLRRAHGPIHAVQIWVESQVGISPDLFWGVLAWSGLITELFMCVAVLVLRTRGIAVILGIGFHLAIEFLLGLRISLFTWYMLSLFVLVMPPEWWERIAVSGLARWRSYLSRRSLSASLSWGVLGGAILIGALALQQIPLEGMTALAGLTAGVAFLGGIAMLPVDRLRLAACHLAACVGLVVLHLGSGAVVARYAEAAIDAGTRGELEKAQVYARQAIHADQEAPAARRVLGDLLRAAGHHDEAVLAYDQALDRAPDSEDSVRAQAGKALSLRRLDRIEDSYLAAREALLIDPDTDLLPRGDSRLEEYRRLSRENRLQ
jgi:hypothetical protein